VVNNRRLQFPWTLVIRGYIARAARQWLREEGDHGVHNAYPILIDGHECWKPASNLTAADMRTYIADTQRPLIVPHLHSLRRNEVAGEIARYEARLPAAPLMIGDVADPTAQALYWLNRDQPIGGEPLDEQPIGV